MTKQGASFYSGKWGLGAVLIDTLLTFYKTAFEPAFQFKWFSHWHDSYKYTRFPQKWMTGLKLICDFRMKMISE